MRDLLLWCDFILGDLHVDNHLSFGGVLAPSSPETESLNKPYFSGFFYTIFSHLMGKLWQG